MSMLALLKRPVHTPDPADLMVDRINAHAEAAHTGLLEACGASDAPGSALSDTRQDPAALRIRRENARHAAK